MKKPFLPLLCCLSFFGLVLGVAAVDPSKHGQFKVGTASADITPQEPVRLGGYASRNKPHEGIEHRIFVKALALEDEAGAVTLVLSADTIGTPRWFNDELAGRIERELAIPRERFLFISSHSHTTPVVSGCLEDMYGLVGEEAEATKRYTRYFLDQSFAAAKAALAEREPVTLRFGQGRAGFAGNRRAFTEKGVGFGINPNGAVDHEVPVLCAERPDGSRKAVVFGYACHCTTPGDSYQVCGDWAGFAQDYIEQADPGVTAMFITGCGADSNPNPRGSHRLARMHGLELAGAVANTLREPTVPVRGPVSVAFDRVELPFEDSAVRSRYEELAKDKQPATQRYAKRYLDMLDRGETLPTSYPCPVQVLRFGGDLTLVALGGEVVVDYSLRLKRELADRRLWMAGYSNDVFAYVPSVRILHEGGYEADRSITYFGLPTRFSTKIEDLIVGRVIEMVNALDAP